MQESSVFCCFGDFFPPQPIWFSARLLMGQAGPPCVVPAAGMCQERIAGRGQSGTAHSGSTLSCSFCRGMILKSQLDLFVFSEMIYTLFDSLLFDLPDFKATIIPLEKCEMLPKPWILNVNTQRRWTSACCFFCRALFHSLASLPALPGQVLTPGAFNITNPSTPWNSHAVCISTEPDVWEHRSVRCCHPSALFRSHQSSTSEVPFFLFLELSAFWALDAVLCVTGEFCLVGCWSSSCVLPAFQPSGSLQLKLFHILLLTFPSPRKGRGKVLFRSWSLCPRSDFMFQKETGVAFSQSSGVSVLTLEKPPKVIQLFRQTHLNFWILTLPEDKYKSPLSRHVENRERLGTSWNRSLLFCKKIREGLKAWILILNFPVQEPDHVLWCILYLKTKHWDNNLGNLVLPIPKFNFSCRIEKKSLKEWESCKLFSLFSCNSRWIHPYFFFPWLFFSSFQQFPLLSPGMSYSCWPQEGSAFHHLLGSKGMKGTVGKGYPPRRIFTSKWWSWLRVRVGKRFSGKEGAKCYERWTIVIWIYSVALKSSFFGGSILSKAPLAALSGHFLPFTSMSTLPHACEHPPVQNYSHHHQEGFVAS